MATTRFFIESKSNPANIYISLSIASKKVLKRKTGYVIDPDKWSEVTDLPKQTDEESKKLTSILKKLAAGIEEKLNAQTTLGEDISGEWLHGQIDMICDNQDLC
jgi:hypothetical protein